MKSGKSIMPDTALPDSYAATNPLVCTIILNYNNVFDTIETLNSVNQLSYKNNTVLLIENSSESEVIDLIRPRFPALEIIENGKNLGYAGGNNVGIKRAIECGADYIFILNNDVILETDALEKLVHAMSANPNCAACQPIVAYYDHPNTVWSAGTSLYFAYPRLYLKGKNMRHIQQIGRLKPPFGLVGCALLFRTASLKKIGLFDESLFLLQEETDWCMRAVKKGFGLLVVCDAVVHHKVSVTLGQFSKEYLYYIARNWLLVAKKYNGRKGYAYVLLTELFTRIPYYLYQLARKNQIAMMKYYYYGLRDGLQGVSGERDFDGL